VGSVLFGFGQTALGFAFLRYRKARPERAGAAFLSMLGVGAAAFVAVWIPTPHAPPAQATSFGEVTRAYISHSRLDKEFRLDLADRPMPLHYHCGRQCPEALAAFTKRPSAKVRFVAVNNVLVALQADDAAILPWSAGAARLEAVRRESLWGGGSLLGLLCVIGGAGLVRKVREKRRALSDTVASFTSGRWVSPFARPSGTCRTWSGRRGRNGSG